MFLIFNYYIIMYKTYGEIVIWDSDLKIIEKISDKIDVDYYDADLFLEDENTNPKNIANQVIFYLLTKGVLKHVNNKEDQEKLLDSILLDSVVYGYNIDPTELGKEGQKYLNFFNS